MAFLLRLNLLVGMARKERLPAMQGAVTAYTAGCKRLVFGAQMSKKALAKVELARTASVPLYFLRRPGQTRNPDGVIRDLTAAALKERGRRLLVVDRDIKPGRVWSLCELVHRSTGLDCVIAGHGRSERDKETKRGAAQAGARKRAGEPQ